MNNPQAIQVRILNRKTGKTILVMPIVVASRELAIRNAIAHLRSGAKLAPSVDLSTLISISVIQFEAPPVGLESVDRAVLTA